MLSQISLQTPKEFIIYEDSDQGGHTKTRNPSPGYVQRRSIHAGDTQTNYRISVELYACVHGWIDETRTESASLIIFDAQFVVVNNGDGIIRWAQLTFDFHNQEGGETASNPHVLSYAPFAIEEILGESNNVTRLRQQIEAGAGAGSGLPASADVRYTWERESEYQKRYFDRGDAGRLVDARQNRYSGVWWSLTKGKDPHDRQRGVRPNCRFAVLLRRSDPDAPFTCSFRLAVNAGFWYAAARQFDNWTGRAEIDDPILFDPRAAPLQGQGGMIIDPLRLGLWRDDGGGERLKTLVKIPGLEPIQAAASAVE